MIRFAARGLGRDLLRPAVAAGVRVDRDHRARGQGEDDRRAPAERADLDHGARRPRAERRTSRRRSACAAVSQPCDLRACSRHRAAAARRPGASPIASTDSAAAACSARTQRGEHDQRLRADRAQQRELGDRHDAQRGQERHAAEREHVLHAEVADGQQRHRARQHEQGVGGHDRLGPEREPQHGPREQPVDDQHRHRDHAHDRQRAHQHGARILPVASGAGRLRQQIQADADRHPHDGLRRDGGGRVGTRRVAADLALDQDHVDVLQQRDQEQPDHRRPRSADEVAQSPRLGAGDRRDRAARARSTTGRTRSRPATAAFREYAPVTPIPARHQDQPEAQPAERLEDDRPGHRLVEVRALQGAALDRQQQPQHRRWAPPRPRPTPPGPRSGPRSAAAAARRTP